MVLLTWCIDRGPRLLASDSEEGDRVGSRGGILLGVTGAAALASSLLLGTPPLAWFFLLLLLRKSSTSGALVSGKLRRVNCLMPAWQV